MHELSSTLFLLGGSVDNPVYAVKRIVPGRCSSLFEMKDGSITSKASMHRKSEAAQK
jgi:hypothetical protein